MNSGDFDTKLDEALGRLPRSDAPRELSWDVPEIEELVLAAQRLHTLAPAPIPSLEKGRSKFLAQAAHIGTQAGSTHRWPLQLGPRRLVAFTASAVILLVAGMIVMLIAGSFAAGIPGAAGWWFSSTPTMRPTYTATPTQISLAPVDSIRSGWISEIDSHHFLPPPNPAPQAEASRQTLR